MSNQPNGYGAGSPFTGQGTQQGGLGDWQGLVNNLVGVQASANPYEQGVLGGQFLDIGNNPFIGGIANALTQRSEESLGRNLSQLSSPFAGAGGTMGFTGINAATRGRALDESGQNLSNALAQLFGGAYESERGRQQETAGLLSGRTQSLIGAGAQGYGADQALRGQKAQARATVQSAQIRADASLEAAQLAQQLGYSELAAQLYQDYERNSQFASQQQFGLPEQYLGAIFPSLFGFGPETTSGFTGGGSPFLGFAGGALGGAAEGQDIFGGKGGGSSTLGGKQR